MSKGQILLGKQRGKVGGFVARVDSGVGQILSEYNPHPKNPRTPAQVDQRAKMNLAGQISKMTPASVIVGMDPNGRKARSKYVSNMLRNIEIVEDETKTVELAYPNLKFSAGMNKAMHVTGTFSEELMQVTLAFTPAEVTADVLGCLVVGVQHPRTLGDGGDKIFVLHKVVPKSEMSGTSYLNVVDTEGVEAYMELYTVPIIESAAGVAATFEAMQADLDAFEAGYMRALANAQAFCATNHCGSAHIQYA